MSSDKFNDLQQKLDLQVCEAFENSDFVGLAHCYRKWGGWLLDNEYISEGCFYLTQAYILSLEYNLDMTQSLHHLLIAHDREV